MQRNENAEELHRCESSSLWRLRCSPAILGKLELVFLGAGSWSVRGELQPQCGALPALSVRGGLLHSAPWLLLRDKTDLRRVLMLSDSGLAGNLQVVSSKDKTRLLATSYTLAESRWLAVTLRHRTPLAAVQQTFHAPHLPSCTT
ncbi:hypothetical protein B5807_04385 [Epicoccum nigrum]|uniref:Uncharacterized protein n=1 Tax=Epicoccum nigrum TaxID=105696 RepID=A0A1Y2M4W6_EPING|nr:hypothetical protein B5807_04385 [Epicoccum nigrum]